MSKKSKCLLIGAVCPETSNPLKGNYCPLWNDEGELFTLTNTVTGEERVERCGARVMVKGQIEVIKASNRPAAVMEDMRNKLSTDLANGFKKVAGVLSTINNNQISHSKKSGLNDH